MYKKMFAHVHAHQKCCPLIKSLVVSRFTRVPVQTRLYCIVLYLGNGMELGQKWSENEAVCLYAMPYHVLCTHCRTTGQQNCTLLYRQDHSFPEGSSGMRASTSCWWHTGTPALSR